ncbi:fimbrial biogenesis chaperone [Serratia silvae]|uniref:Molecular chaperone n=1 Tax=Serratia silvae TaxID=2824122 RepID=A0ABT0K6V1_9GAMM|nr:molecular chaperone [Serratia silvae]MCL1027750.1 molecular chaperone [Serratia silvae]
MKRLGLAMLLLCSLSFSTASRAAEPESKGISFYVLRVIYPESTQKGVSLKVYNKSAAPYLMQSWVRPVDSQTGDVDLDYDGQVKMPFIITPPLTRFEADSELTLRIRRNGEPLPSDRESVFFISMKAIPAMAQSDQQPTANQMAVTVVSNMKLFYRPEGLAKRAVADVACQLRFRHSGEMLIADNPTPYWLTFSRLKVGNVALDKPVLRLMVPPKGQQRYTLPTAASGSVQWQLIDEDGWNTPACQQTL